ncbi:MAG: hypothetical protein WAW61_15125 [Methylococcaceae bacterium]
MAFWLVIFDHAQVNNCASEKKPRVKKLWWKMKEIVVKPLPHGVIKQAIYDILDESEKERIIDKRKVREMRHEAGVGYLAFTPKVMILGALLYRCVISA